MTCTNYQIKNDDGGGKKSFKIKKLKTQKKAKQKRGASMDGEDLEM